jgi:ubiquinol-cytochrome c reductase cytochrome b subunit
MTSWLIGLRGWVDDRLPIMRAWNTHMGQYYAPKNFNFWYFFGVLSLLMLVNQLLTGIWLTMSYTPTAEGAFASVEYIMRDVDYGWIIRYMHSTGASAFFAVVYLHMFRGLLYGSYKKPRELVWLFGMLIYLCLMAEGFMGYVLPWGQMSYWGAQVIVSLFGAIPLIGEDIVQWVRGDYLISGITLNRFFALHVVAIPLILVMLVVLHLLALHEVGSNNPDGVEIKKTKGPDGKPLDGIPFHPYYTVHDLVGIAVFLFVFCFILFFMPEMGGFFLEYANFEEANNLKTPAHIAPVWYYTPFYAMLRAVPDKLGGFIIMAAAIAIMFVLPWLDKSPVKSIRYKGNLSRVAIVVFVVSFIILGVLGVKAPTPARTALAQICTVLYFAFFLLMPLYTWLEKTKPEPKRVTMNGGMGFWKFMGVLAVVGLLVFLPLKAVGSEAKSCGSIECEQFVPDLHDEDSLQRGAKYFANYCMGCHSLAYMRYERMADDLDIPHDIVQQNLNFTGGNIGGLMTVAASAKAQKKWFGATPPDLTLVARARSPEWLYTYLRNFYQDEARPYGVNNRVFKDVGMPHAMLELQGMAKCAPGSVHAENGGIKRDPLTREEVLFDAETGAALNPCGRLTVEKAAKLNTEEFDQAIGDLVNYLAYVGEPSALKRQRMGVYALFFVSLFFVVAWLLNREYWKDVH